LSAVGRFSTAVRRPKGRAPWIWFYRRIRQTQRKFRLESLAAPMNPTLVIANKTYSSWSFRPWVLMRHFGIAFDEIVIPMAQENSRAEMLRFSPAGKCPSLHDGKIVVWDSLAIIEYVAELHPRMPVWPRPRAARHRPVHLPLKCIRASWASAGCCR
jgi:hypothetical protein